LSKIRQQRRPLCYPTLYVVREEGDPALRVWFFSHLSVDRQDNGMSYYQFLQALKDKVANEKF
jgi:protein transport protein SEC24